MEEAETTNAESVVDFLTGTVFSQGFFNAIIPAMIAALVSIALVRAQWRQERKARLDEQSNKRRLDLNSLAANLSRIDNFSNAVSENVRDRLTDPNVVPDDGVFNCDKIGRFPNSWAWEYPIKAEMYETFYLLGMHRLAAKSEMIFAHANELRSLVNDYNAHKLGYEEFVSLNPTFSILDGSRPLAELWDHDEMLTSTFATKAKNLNATLENIRDCSIELRERLVEFNIDAEETVPGWVRQDVSVDLQKGTKNANP